MYGTIGGDAELSPRGEQYALKLPELVAQSVAVSIFSRLTAEEMPIDEYRTGERSQSGHRHYEEQLRLPATSQQTTINYNGKPWTN